MYVGVCGSWLPVTVLTGSGDVRRTDEESEPSLLWLQLVFTNETGLQTNKPLCIPTI